MVKDEGLKDRAPDDRKELYLAIIGSIVTLVALVFGG